MLTKPEWKDLTRKQKADLLAPLLLQGMTASGMAARFNGVTRNAIIGFCHRLKMKLPNGTPPKAKTPPKQRKIPTVPRPPKGNPVSAPLPRRRSEPMPMTAVPFIEALDAGLCKWPLWGAGEAVGLCCGATRAEASPYCGHHKERSIGRGTESERTADKVMRKYA